MNVTVRNLDETVFRRFKGKAAERGMKMGTAMSHAMRLFIENGTTSQKRAPKKQTWGRDSTNKEIDSLLYGE